ncbi:peptide deformylase [Legionella sp. km772]|uniref:peptide deformylase n=1 Tax=Legionella sp. km772 TaxID=2498111 RepID=UPI0013154EED|nr:peptide deformylase [Legionella sp. km772]
MNPVYHPTTAIETLKSRCTAIYLLQKEQAHVRRQAEAFIKKTSIYSENDLKRLQKFSSLCQNWDSLEFCSTYTNLDGHYVEYKLFWVDEANRKRYTHYHALYQITQSRCYFVSQTKPLIRIIGDPILHQPGIFFPQKPNFQEQQELERQIIIAKDTLVKTKGAGIAANQCAEIEKPYCFTIVGVFYELPAHVEGVARRYPNSQFPPAQIMVNPRLSYSSELMQTFNHACLSVPCANRCEVLSPQQLVVEYLDPLQDMRRITKVYNDLDAVVLWHELSHILDGKTYIDLTFAALSEEDLLQCKNILQAELNRRQHT